MAATRSLALWALAGSLFLGALFLVAMPRAARSVVTVVVAVAAVTFFGSYERLREGVRKPFLIHSDLFSNGLRIDDIERVNEQGVAAVSGWAAAHSEDPLAYGREIFKVQCSSCHTLDGYRAIRPRLPTTADMIALTSGTEEQGQEVFRTQCASCHDDYTYQDVVDFVPGAEDIREDPELVGALNEAMITGTLEKLREMGERYAAADRSAVFDTRETLYPYMAPFVGNDGDLEALAAYLFSLEEQDADPTQVAHRRPE